MARNANKTRYILLVEDDSAIGVLLNRVLHGTVSHRLIVCTSGEEALAVLREREIDLVITDCVMPGLDGLKLTEMIKAERPQLPVLAISAVSTQDMRQRAHSAGADRFIAKPFALSELEDALLTALGDNT
jgi:CheY-like chemotaxis protein